MVRVEFDDVFKKTFSKIKDPVVKKKIIKQVKKLKDNPELGKPMRYARKGTRELYVPPFRLSYMFVKEKDTLVLLDIYHKDVQ